MITTISVKAELFNCYAKSGLFVSGFFAPLGPNETIDLRSAELSAKAKKLIQQFRSNLSISPAPSTAPAFLAGIFVSRGSLAMQPRPRLTLSFTNQATAMTYFALLSRQGISFLQLFQPARTVLYLKKWEQIADFLRLLGAHQTLLELESERAASELKSELLRGVQLDTANQARLSAASQRFLSLMASVDESTLRAHFQAPALLFFQLKKAHPHDSLQELVVRLNKRLGTSYTRQGASHWLTRLRELNSTLL